MAYSKKKKKTIWTKQDQDWVDKMLNASKKWHRPYKGEIVFIREDCPQEFMIKAKYNTKEELEKDAAETVAYMNSIDKEKTWTLISAKLVGQTVDDTIDD